MTTTPDTPAEGRALPQPKADASYPRRPSAGPPRFRQHPRLTSSEPLKGEITREELDRLYRKWKAEFEARDVGVLGVDGGGRR